MTSKIGQSIKGLCQTSCDINVPIFQHTLTKSQYQTSRAFNQKKLLEIYIIKFKATFDEEVSNTKNNQTSS
jgi:hypothetical protein